MGTPKHDLGFRAERGPQTGNPKRPVGISQQYKDPGRYVPILFLLHFWGSLF